MATAHCEPLPVSHRRIFWTTQPTACGEYVDCGENCAIPGLQYIEQEGDYITGQRGRTFATNDWLRSLILNILNTRGRAPAVKCGIPPMAIDGHWSETYRQDGQYSGTLIWSKAQISYKSIQDAVKMLNAQLQADLSKLVQMGVASSVKVETKYTGSNKVSTVITVTGPMYGETHVNLTSERLANEWVWR